MYYAFQNYVNTFEDAPLRYIGELLFPYMDLFSCLPIVLLIIVLQIGT